MRRGNKLVHYAPRQNRTILRLDELLPHRMRRKSKLFFFFSFLLLGSGFGIFITGIWGRRIHSSLLPREGKLDLLMSLRTTGYWVGKLLCWVFFLAGKDRYTRALSFGVDYGIGLVLGRLEFYKRHTQDKRYWISWRVLHCFCFCMSFFYYVSGWKRTQEKWRFGFY